MSAIQEFKKDNFIISTDKDLLDVNAIHTFLANQSYWAQGISRETVQKFIANSLVFGLYSPAGQIGFARIITDKAVFAYLADVFILPEHRGKGLSKWLMECVLAHPDLQGLKKWLLATKDAHGLYTQFGFTPLANPEKMMERRAEGLKN